MKIILAAAAITLLAISPAAASVEEAEKRQYTIKDAARDLCDTVGPWRNVDGGYDTTYQSIGHVKRIAFCKQFMPKGWRPTDDRYLPFWFPQTREE